MKYIIYLRVSTDLQDVRTQEQECLKYIGSKENGRPFQYEIYSDPDVTSRIKMKDREGLMDMLNNLKRGDQVVVFKLDRLSRDVVEMVTIYRMIKDNKCGIHSLNDNDCDNEFMIGLMGVLAQKERSDISMRIKAKLTSKKERNERVSRFIPYGFELADDKIHLKPLSEEQTVLLQMCQWFDEGKSYRNIAQALKMSGCNNRQGKPFQHMSIYRILLRTGRTRSWDQLPEEKEALMSHSR